MRILFLTSRLPYPPYRGDKLRTWNLIKQISKKHEITLLSFIQDKSERKWIDELKVYCKEIQVVHLPLRKSLMNCLMAIAKATPFQVAYFLSGKMKWEIEKTIKCIQPDVIHTHLIRMAPYAAEYSHIPQVIDQTDSISLYLNRFKTFQRNPLGRFLIGIEYKRMLDYETILSRFNRVLVCSDLDRRAIIEVTPEALVEIIENGVDIATLPTGRQIRPEPFRIIFTGNMSYFPNAHGARFFVNEIFPIIKKQQPATTLYIVGQNPPASVRSLAGEDVIVTGFVKDIYLEYQKSSVAIAPIRFGAGTQYKILESLALGIPTVSTSIGVNGIGLHAGKEILLADDPEQFAAAVLRLFKDPSLREMLSRNSSQLIREHFNWEGIGKKLDNVYHSVSAPIQGARA
ncbi:MAG: glycosyltransferase [Ignavibacteriae bacterium]|nr:glycosyltransferase [Ignavibacteria bacterium]MBI3364691.1 glycosyltransferase [Ignavibacteriota bacterium]